MRTSRFVPRPVGAIEIVCVPPSRNDQVKTTWRLVAVLDLVLIVWTNFPSI